MMTLPLQRALWHGRTMVWFSCGAASAVAAKLAIERVPDAVVLYHDLSASEHPDSARFFSDVERWIGTTITRTHSPKYSNIDEVFEGERFLVGPHGAPCTRALKRDVGDLLMDFNDTNVFGFTADEEARIKRFERREPDIRVWWILRDLGITKERCFSILVEAGITLPAMYGLGFKNNNCLGCVKSASVKYWKMVRKNFPDVFWRRAAQERKFGFPVMRKMYLDELPPDDGENDSDAGMNVSCGPLCAFDEVSENSNP